MAIGDENLISGYSLKYIRSKKRILMDGSVLKNIKFYKSPDDFKVLAVIHLYNEVDIIKKTTEYLLSEGIDVYLVDNWSEDGSFEVIQHLAEINPHRIFIERFPQKHKTDYYDWYHQLERTEQISKELNYDWFIHYDADEMRISPWTGVSLKDTIYRIDQLGFNLIENTVIEFKLTHTFCNSIFMEDVWFDFGHRKGHFEQIKSWKKDNSIDLKNSGGHKAVIDNPRIFPLKILNRHYPLRSVKQAEKKIFYDRKPRFLKEKKERGWHGHYDTILKISDFIHDEKNLIKWDKYTFEEYYIPLFTGAGIYVENEDEGCFMEDYKIEIGSNIALYGAGKLGIFLFKLLNAKFNIVCWVDSNYKRISYVQGMQIQSPEKLKYVDVEKIIIAVEKEQLADEIRQNILCYGIGKDKILWNPIKQRI